MPLFERLRDATKKGEGVALATVVAGPEGVGQKMLIFADGANDGDLGSESLKSLVLEASQEMLAAERTDILTYETDDGHFEVFIESFPEPARLLIVGAGHVAEALSRFGKMLGYEVVVTDARAAFASKERFPEADEVIKGWPQDVLPRFRLGEKTFVVLLSHDVRFDQPTLEIVLPSRVSYVGAIGSRKTQRERFERLRQQGFSEEQLAKIRGPVGLDLGGKSPEEMALAIMAEITAVRRGRSGSSLRDTVPSE